MKLEKVYSDLLDIINNDMDLLKALKLKENIEKAIREETCYKTTSKTRINAIKRVASKQDVRPSLQCYGIVNVNNVEYKVITDAYHLIAIKDDNIPLKVCTTDNNIIEKVGKDNCYIGDYPIKESVFNNYFSINKDNPITLDYDDVMAFYKLHKDDKNELFKINNITCDIKFVKNVLDVLGKNVKVYTSEDTAPIWFVNEKEELGLVLPIKVF